MPENSKRTVVVTGGSRGIGRAICLAFAEQNTSIIFNYFSPANPEAEAAAAAETEALLGSLYDLLVAANIMYPADGPNEFLMMPGNFSTSLVAAHVNYNAIREDRSMGFHNPGYTEAVLKNTIESLSAK